MDELLVMLDGDPNTHGQGLEITGAVRRDFAHRHGIPHGSTLVAVFVARRDSGGDLAPGLLLHRRSVHKEICPGTWALCGGHLQADVAVLESVDRWQDARYMEDLFERTALRELNEECKIISERLARPFQFGRSHLRRIDRVGSFTVGLDDPDARNREYATLYAAVIPEDVLRLEPSEPVESVFQITDSCQTQDTQQAAALELGLLTVEALLRDFREDQKGYADGIARVLRRALREPDLLRAVNEFVAARMGSILPLDGPFA